MGLAAAYPVARAFAQAGAQVSAIVAARTEELLILEDRFAAIPGVELLVVTDDGSRGERGFATTPLERLCAADKVDAVFAVGPVPMMAACSRTAAGLGVPVTVSLNPVMLDGTGMCGGCRVKVGDEYLHACVDGPDFDGHLVDFDDAMRRGVMYRSFEAEAREGRSCGAHAGDERKGA